jgi:hypothetical protein
MPLFDYVCPKCSAKYERYIQGNGHLEKRHNPLCEVCGVETEKVEYSLVARRNPEKGIQT